MHLHNYIYSKLTRCYHFAPLYFYNFFATISNSDFSVYYPSLRYAYRWQSIKYGDLTGSSVPSLELMLPASTSSINRYRYSHWYLFIGFLLIFAASSILNATCALIDWYLSSCFNSLHTFPHENALSMAYYLAISLVDKVFQPCWDCFTSMTSV